jgi:putative glycosyltransferase (TIGR04372 family)
MQKKLKVSQLFEQVKEFDQAGSFLQLLDKVNILLSKDPHNSEYLLYKLKALDGLGKITSDIKLLEHYVNMRSTDSTGFILLYQAYLEKKDTAGALIALAYALSINPDDEQCINLLLDLLRVVDPKYKRLKINILTLGRIGHLSSEIEPLMRKVKGEQEQDCLYLFISNTAVSCNSYLLSLLKNISHIIVAPFWHQLYVSRPTLLDDFFFADFPYDLNSGLRGKSNTDINIQGFKSLVNIYQSYPKCTEIPPSDANKAWQILSELGINRTDKLVCLHVRDSAYLSSFSAVHDFSYHDFRDAKIETYKKAVEHLISQGFKVVRIGANTNQQLEINDPNYFDFCLQRDELHGDFLEVFILDVCQFFIANYGGPYGVAAMLDTPTLVVNGVPIQQPYMKYGRFIPKRLFQGDKEVNLLDVCSDKPLSEENNTPIYLSFNSAVFEKYGYRYIDNTDDEILQAVIEFEKSVENRILDMTLTKKQMAYFNALPDSFCHKNKCVITDSFLTEHENTFKLATNLVK